MPRDPTRNQISNGLTYVANTPSFLQNFGKRPPTPPPADRFAQGSSSRQGREPLPERPSDGKWARGSDDEGDGKGQESDDEWGEIYGGGGDDGPQVVVLKEGRHLTAEDVKRERRIGETRPYHELTSLAAGKASKSPSPERPVAPKEQSKQSKPKAQIPKTQPSSTKRKLVGQDEGAKEFPAALSGKVKKKKKMDKGLLSFNEAEEET